MKKSGSKTKKKPIKEIIEPRLYPISITDILRIVRAESSLKKAEKKLNDVEQSKKDNSKKGGSLSKRKPDEKLILEAKRILSDHDLPYSSWSKKRLYIHLNENGFEGSQSWVKKHFDTITRLP